MTVLNDAQLSILSALFNLKPKFKTHEYISYNVISEAINLDPEDIELQIRGSNDFKGLEEFDYVRSSTPTSVPTKDYGARITDAGINALKNVKIKSKLHCTSEGCYHLKDYEPTPIPSTADQVRIQVCHDHKIPLEYNCIHCGTSAEPNRVINTCKVCTFVIE